MALTPSYVVIDATLAVPIDASAPTAQATFNIELPPLYDITASAQQTDSTVLDSIATSTLFAPVVTDYNSVSSYASSAFMLSTSSSVSALPSNAIEMAVSSKSGISRGTIGGIALGASLLTLVSIAIIACILKKMRKSKQTLMQLPEKETANFAELSDTSRKVEVSGDACRYELPACA